MGMADWAMLTPEEASRLLQESSTDDDGGGADGSPSVTIEGEEEEGEEEEDCGPLQEASDSLTGEFILKSLGAEGKRRRSSEIQFRCAPLAACCRVA